MAGMLEDAEIHRLLMRLDAPGDGVTGLYIDPAHQIGLRLSTVVLGMVGRDPTLLWTSNTSMPAMMEITDAK